MSISLIKYTDRMETVFETFEGVKRTSRVTKAMTIDEIESEIEFLQWVHSYNRPFIEIEQYGNTISWSFFMNGDWRCDMAFSVIVPASEAIVGYEKTI